MLHMTMMHTTVQPTSATHTTLRMTMLHTTWLQTRMAQTVEASSSDQTNWPQTYTGMSCLDEDSVRCPQYRIMRTPTWTATCPNWHGPQCTQKCQKMMKHGPPHWH